LDYSGPKVKEIFVAALDCEPGADRTAYLDEACQGDAELRRRVDVLLRAHERAQEVLGPTREPGIDEPTVLPTAHPLPTAEPAATLVANSASTEANATRDEVLAQDRHTVDATAAQTGGAAGNGLQRGDRIRYFGDYEIYQELGRGGMGVVYQARQMTLNRLVALKMIRAGVLADDVELRRFQNEAEAVAQLDHPGIVPVYEVGEHQDQRYFSMKLVPGGSLGGRLDAYKDDPRAAAALLAEVARAVEHAHARGILHRDLKPANILLDGQGKPHVTDFGLAKKLEESIELTQSGAVMGTPAYMAPEQSLGRRGAVTTASDVYGLGAVLYAVLTGRAPFQGDSVIDTLQAVRERQADPPSRLNRRVPRDLELICLKALEKDPRRRYPSARELADDLNRWLKGEPVIARRVSTSVRAWMWCKRRPAIAGLSAALVLVALIGLVAAGTQWRAAVANAAEATANAERAMKSEQDAVQQRDALARSNRGLRLAGYASAMQLAQREWELGNVPRVRTVLSSLQPAKGEDDLRGFEWNYLRRQCDDAALTLKLPGGFAIPYGRPDRIEISPDGSRVLAVAGGRIIGWSLPGGQPITMAAALDRFVLDARFRPDGKRLAVLVLTLGGKPFPANGSLGNSPAELEVWDVPTDKRLRSAKLQIGDYGNLAFRPGGQQVAVRLNQFEGPRADTGHNRVTVVEVETGRLVHTLEGKPINEAIVYSPDGSLLVGPLDFHTLNVWDAESGRVVHTLDTKQDIIRDAAFRPDGARLAVVGDGGLVTIWSVPSWEPLQSLRVSEQHAMRCRYSRDGKSLATLGLNWIKIWDGGTGEYRFLIRGAGSDLSYTPDDGRIAALVDGGTVRFWDAKQEQGAFVHKAKTNLYDASFSGDGRRIVDASGSILDALTGAVVRSLPTPNGETMSDAVLFPDSKRAIFIRYKSDPPIGRIMSGDLILWDVEAGREIKRLEEFRFPHCLEISPDGRWLLTLVTRENDDTYTQSELTLRDATTWEPVYTRKDPAVYGSHAVFSSDSKSILLGKKDHVALVEVPSGRELATYGPLLFRPLALALSPDARWVAAATSDGGPAERTIHIWNAASRAEALVIPQTAGETVTTLSFSPDGRRLASAGFDAKIKIWDTESGLELLTLNGHTSWIWKTHFSPDGRRILSCGRDKTLRLWDASPLGADAAH
jgi:WD40 repeat protein/tRNA A-37 threonylcarbamoyl transferase component Bud32